MSAAFSSWFLIGLAALAANLPFFNERLFAIVPVHFAQRVGRMPYWQRVLERIFSRSPVKPFWVRLLELFILYFAVGGVAYLLEARIGGVFRQGWEFYAVTGCLFLVLAFPGFVYRYLRKHHG